MKHDWRRSLLAADQLIITTSTVDNSVTIPIDSANSPPGSMSLKGSWWFVCITGTPARINQDAAATTAQVLQNIGDYAQPVQLKPGAVMHAIADIGTGAVGFIRALPSFF